MEARLQRWLGYTQRFVMYTRPAEILGATGSELCQLTGARRVMVSSQLSARTWREGAHLDVTSAQVVTASAAVCSAMFAVYRRLSRDRVPVVLADDVVQALGCDRDTVVNAIPVMHRTGRLWGAIAIVGELAPEHADEVAAIAELAALALENAQRLAIARRDQDRSLLLAEAIDDAFYDWSFDASFWWGRGILDLLGSGEAQVEYAPEWKDERIHPEDRERVRVAFEVARDSQDRTWHSEYRFRRNDGSYLLVEDRGYFLRDEAGRAYRLVGAMRDITLLRDLLVREQAARADAERANLAKDEFLALLGHELRNPLAPIVTGLELLRQRGDGAPVRELDVLDRQAQRLVRLVDDLLDISRIANRKIELKLERVEVARVVHAAIEIASPLIENQQHQLSVDVAATGLAVNADPDRLAQAISNLLTNAAKYTPPGGTISVRAWLDAGIVTIAVRDSGIGIEPEMLATVFQIFVQERQALDRARGGLGIGLSIVKSLVELHGGSIAATSEGRGLGSEFSITLPLAAPAASVVAPAPQARVAVSGHRILVVDDNEDAAALLAMLLERLGNTVEVAHDGPAALAVVDRFAPDLAVLDIGLPHMDGYELARTLRARNHRDLPLVALTGYGQESDRALTTSAGFNAHLVKPVTVRALESVIASFLGDR